MISGGIEDSRYLLFNLTYLQKLNLAYNYFNRIQIPKGLSNLANLTHLNLSYCAFGGQIPTEVLKLKKLVSLDLSQNYDLKLENPDLKMLAQNLTELEELYLDGIDISSRVNDWFQVLSSSLPDLRILSLIRCKLSGPIGSSLLRLRSLSVLRLDYNYDLNSTVPDFLANFSTLTTLSLSGCSLFGSFPHKIFEMPSLQFLDVSINYNLSGMLPNFSKEGSLRTIRLGHTNFSGPLPDSISNLTMLSTLDLGYCSFSGPIPRAIGNLTELTVLNIVGNSFIGSLPSTLFEGLSNLESINLGQNLFGGNIPSSLFTLPSLRSLHLYENEFEGQVQELSNMSSSSLQVLVLASNHLEGPIPKFVFELDQLVRLDLSSNKFNGTVDLKMFKSSNLEVLVLSDNDLFIQSTKMNDSTLSNIYYLGLASCKLQRFPDLIWQSRTLQWLDLSSNNFKGEIPKWIWEVGNESLNYLNLSNNQFHGFQKPFKFPSRLYFLDLHSNQLKGELPVLHLKFQIVDFSYNHFTNSIPNDIGAFLDNAIFFSISNNNFSGEIPLSICNATRLYILDLSGNSLSGSIPPCLPNIKLNTLNLGRNNLNGSIPDTFSDDCSVRSLDLNKNVLRGKIPRSLANCGSLEVLNIGNNGLEDTFPCMLIKTHLRVLVLRSNKFYGDLRCPPAFQEWSNLQIIDISRNEFSGGISFLPFSKWRGMISANDNKLPHQSGGLSFLSLSSNGLYYQDEVTVNMKGGEIELKKILNIYRVIDFSSNKFHGEIPYSIGDLNSLYALSLSNNEFTGSIPESIGKMTQLGSLDLSANKLTGKIPVELANLTFLSFLNLSQNELSGKIPTGHQIQTFPAAFEGNVGLCGFPTDISCNKEEGGVLPNGGRTSSKKEIDWDYIFPALGFAVGLGGTMWILLHCKKLKEIYFGKVDQILLKLFPRKW